MSVSYLPSGVKISCTLMTITAPQQLGVSRAKKNVLAKSGSLWLNVDDKKLSATFVCQSPKKFWSGLGSMFMGLAVGIAAVAIAVVVVAAIVGTGGVAGVVLAGLAAGAASTATSVLVGGLVVAGTAALLVEPAQVLIGKFTEGHPCDCTLEDTSKWLNFHKKSFFDGNNAILQRSTLQCVNGGLLQPFFSAVLAQKAANKFSRNNAEGLRLHQEQQLYMGMVSGFTGLADPLGTSIGIVTGTYDYVKGNNLETLANESSTASQDLQGEIESAKRDQSVGIGTGISQGSIGVVETMTNQNRAIIREVMDQGGTYAQAERMTVWGPKTFGGEFKNMGVGMGVGMGFGIAGAVANHYIADSYKDDKLQLIQDIKRSNAILAFADAGNGTNVVSES